MILGEETKPVMFFEVNEVDGKLKLSEEHLDAVWIVPEEIHEYNLGKFADVLNTFFNEFHGSGEYHDNE